MMMCFLRRSTPICCSLTLFLLFLLYPHHYAFSLETVDDAVNPDQELDEELKYLKAETYVITPSKIPERIEKAPGTIHVVTEKEIRQIGARYLSEVVQTVPGWYVWPMFRGDVFNVRGTSGAMSAEILFMINSHAVNEAFYGSAIECYGDIDLDNVKRIEFVSGPASALYGSGAMGGVINIITKEAGDVDGVQLTGRGGSFDTWEGNALFGKKFGELEVAGYVDYRNTQGFRGHVEEDQQTLLDRRYGTHASLAPGSMKGDLYQWDAQLTLKYGGLKFDGKYIDRNRDLPFGMSREVLDNKSKFDNRDYYLNLSYDTTISEGLDLMVKAYRNQHTIKMNSQVFGKGSLIMTPTGPMMTSVDRFGESWNKSSRMGGEAQVTYEIVHSNTLVGGITFEQQESYDNKGRGNILATSNPFVFIVLPSVQDAPPGYPNPDIKRDVWAAYLEDIWDILDDLRLTIGGRYDHYSDFGGQFSPRVGINWEFAENYHTKFLYGQSFRAPYFLDLYDARFGNPNLKSETQETFELNFGANFHPFSAQITGFHDKLTDAITFTGSGTPPTYKYINADRITRTGAELQLKYNFGRGTYLGMNYTQLTWDFPDENAVAWMEPARFGTLTANIRLNRYLNWNTQLLYRGNWSRSKDDPREDPGDYAIVNTTLIAKDFINELKGLEVRGSILNLFNKDYTSPTGPGELPYDYPMPGINFFLELRYTF